MAMKAAGIGDVNPSDVELLSLLDRGVSGQQLADLATELRAARGIGVRFRYVLRTMAGRLRDASTAGPVSARAAAPADDVFEGAR